MAELLQDKKITCTTEGCVLVRDQRRERHGHSQTWGHPSGPGTVRAAPEREAVSC